MVVVVGGMAGCVPAWYVRMPVLRGRVVDEAGRGVGGAVVEVTRMEDGGRVAEVVAARDGRFVRAEEGAWGVQVPGADAIMRRYWVEARAGERRSERVEVDDGERRWFLFFYDPPVGRDLGEMRVR